MLLGVGAFSACNSYSDVGEKCFSTIIRRPNGNAAVTVTFDSPFRSNLPRVTSMAQEPSYEPTVAKRLRLGGFAEDGLSYKEKFLVRCYEVGMNKTATVETIANLLQEVCANHAQDIGLSTDGFSTTPTMRKFNLIWVTPRMHIEIYKYPAWSDVVEIETWAQMESKFTARRDWLLKDYANGEFIGRCTSKWVMMNQGTRRLQKMTDDVHDEYQKYCPKMRLVFPEENNASLKKIAKLEEPSQYSKHRLVPRRADLDMNMHVNNVTYIAWVMESMPKEIIESHELHSITLDFRRECQHEDVIDSLTSPESVVDDTFLEGNGTNGSHVAEKGENNYLQFLHLLRFSRDGSEINRGRTVWRKKPVKR